MDGLILCLPENHRILPVKLRSGYQINRVVVFAKLYLIKQERKKKRRQS